MVRNYGKLRVTRKPLSHNGDSPKMIEILFHIWIVTAFVYVIIVGAIEFYKDFIK